VLYNGLGRYDEALEAAGQAAREVLGPAAPKWALAELVEAAVRCGHPHSGVEAFELLSAMTRASGTDWARGIQAATDALLHDDAAAEDLHREAIQRLGSTRMRVDLARAQLRYGEWLRRQGRRVDARGQLRAAHEALAAMGVEAFAERARRELLATGETVRRRTLQTRADLTAQEAHIARLATEGHTNSEIAAQLYLSRRTVEWHLSKVFAKLGVTTRGQLRRTLQ
jgi:DNA-binding CsgD family transcriptional regulator